MTRGKLLYRKGHKLAGRNSERTWQVKEALGLADLVKATKADLPKEVVNRFGVIKRALIAEGIYQNNSNDKLGDDKSRL